jgi:hypothetical protein
MLPHELSAATTAKRAPDWLPATGTRAGPDAPHPLALKGIAPATATAT